MTRRASIASFDYLTRFEEKQHSKNKEGKDFWYSSLGFLFALPKLYIKSATSSRIVQNMHLLLHIRMHYLKISPIFIYLNEFNFPIDEFCEFGIIKK